jgi:hypothetical protein
MSSSTINQSMSLFVPHVFTNISDPRIKKVFASQELGVVSSIDRVLKKDRDGKSYHSIYIHFESWDDSETVANFQEKVRAKEGRIVYDDPWFWSVFENTGKKHQAGDRKPVIKMDDSEFPRLGNNSAPPPAASCDACAACAVCAPPASAPALQYQQPEFYMPPPYMLPQYPLPQFMMQHQQPCYDQQQQMFVSSDYVACLEKEMTRLVAENMWLKNMVAELDGQIDEAETTWSCL